MKSPFVPVLIIAGLLGPVAVHAERFTFRPDDESRVEFESRAPLETFTGTTRSISGFVDFDPGDLAADSIQVLVEVDLETLDTGIALRNKHMRENHLETDKFPKATFRGGRVSEASAASLETGETATLAVTGSFEIHGVARMMTVPVEVLRKKDGSLRISTRFEVKLSDHEIERPRFLMLKLDEIQRITFGAKAVSEPGEN